MAKPIELGPDTKFVVAGAFGWALLAAVAVVAFFAGGSWYELRGIRDSQYSRQEMDRFATHLQGANPPLWVPDPNDPSRRVIAAVPQQQTPQSQQR